MALERVSLAPAGAGWARSGAAGSGGTPSGAASSGRLDLSEGKLEADIEFIVSPAAAYYRTAGAGGAALKVFGKDFPGQVGDAPFIGEGQFAGEFLDGNPGHVHCFLVRIILDGELAARGPQEVMMNGFVDAVPADGKPVVDASQRGEDVPLDAGFLSNLADRGLLVVFLALRMPLGQAPFQASAAIKAGDDRHPQFGVGCIHYDAAGRDFLNRGERSRCRMLGRRNVRTDCRRQRCVRPPAGSARYWMGHGVHSNDCCPFVMTGT